MSTPETNTLLAFGRYHYLTSAQLHKLLFARTSRSFSGKILKDLTDQGLLVKDALPQKRHGNPTGVWRLSDRGRKMLARLGVETPRSLGETELFLKHTLSVTDAMLACAFLEEEGVRVPTLTHDLDLKRSRLGVETPTGERVLYAPDAWVDLRLPQGQMGLALEIDMATERERFFRRKVRAILGFADGGYTAWGSSSLTVCFLVPYGNHRVDQLIRWTESELRGLNMEDWGSLFWFLGLDPGLVIPPRWEPHQPTEITVRQYFGDTRWRVAFDPAPRALLGGDRGTP